MDVKVSVDFLLCSLRTRWLNKGIVAIYDWDRIQIKFTEKLFLQSFLINIFSGYISRGK